MTSNRKYDELLQILKARTVVALDLGGVLKDIKNGALWESEIGAGIDTWHQFLSQPEVNMTVNEANQLIKMFELDIPEIESIPLRNLKFLVGKELTDELIEDSKVLSHVDLVERHHDLKTGKEERTYEYLVMKRCKETGSLSKVGGVESEEVKSAFKEKIHE
jgi:hypothetical protein